MYSIIPALMSLLFLFFGLFAVNQKGINRASSSFLALCVVTFFWQFSWAALFLTHDPITAIQLTKMSWLLILVMPTTLYHFSCEVAGVRSDLKFVFASYFFSLLLIAVMIASNQIIDGYYEYFWGYFPKAGEFHWVHMSQTFAITLRALFNTYKRMIAAQGEEQDRLVYCFAGILVFSFSSMDYLGNYGVEFYPIGVLFIMVSLGIILVALLRFELVDSVRSIAASLAHEMRTPMATVKLSAQTLTNYMPILIEGYTKASQAKLVSHQLDDKTLNGVADIAKRIEKEITRSNQAIDMLLAITSNLALDKQNYSHFSAKHCIEESLTKFPFDDVTKPNISFECQNDFQIYGSETLFSFVVFNLLKNALYAIREKGSGEINIKICNRAIELEDTGIGIPPSVLPHIFENFYTTKPRSSNSGVGLAFCRRVVESFEGKMHCQSVHREGTTFVISFSKGYSQAQRHMT